MAELRFSRRALADLRSIRTYLAEHSPRGAANVIRSIDRSLSLLAEFPMMGRVDDRGIGRLHIEPRYRYVISYRIDGDTVEVLYVLHPHRRR